MNGIPLFGSTRITYTLDDVKYIQQSLTLHKGDVVSAFECLEAIKESDAFNDGRAVMWLRKITDIKKKMDAGVTTAEYYFNAEMEEINKREHCIKIISNT